jgi:hypothetical protein
MTPKELKQLAFDLSRSAFWYVVAIIGGWWAFRGLLWLGYTLLGGDNAYPK